jgi:hypothetical protein
MPATRRAKMSEPPVREPATPLGETPLAWECVRSCPQRRAFS